MAPDYKDIIKNPMDLSTLFTNLDAGKYEEWEHLEADVM
jgi:hypothetical protein